VSPSNQARLPKNDDFKMLRLLCALVLLPIAALVSVGLGLDTVPVAAAQKSLAPGPQDSRQSPVSMRLGIGREAKAEEIAGWDIDIRPDGEGLLAGRGTVKDGEAIFGQRCAGCHGEFGEGVGRWPALAGGAGTLTDDRPLKTIGSYWPYASTIIDYIRRAQPFGNAQSLRTDELYAVVAYLLFLNDIVDQNFVLTQETFRKIRMPNEQGFHDDDRETVERAFWNPNPCMTNCKSDVTITARARALDATPTDKAPQPKGD
jgi:mono/diheme cytochrome c family protein